MFSASKPSARLALSSRPRGFASDQQPTWDMGVCTRSAWRLPPLCPQSSPLPRAQLPGAAREGAESATVPEPEVQARSPMSCPSSGTHPSSSLPVPGVQLLCPRPAPLPTLPCTGLSTCCPSLLAPPPSCCPCPVGSLHPFPFCPKGPRCFQSDTPKPQINRSP